jgi:hypothetical protein
MQNLHRVTFSILSALALSACVQTPSPFPGQPWVGADGRVVQPPLEGWPDYTKGAGSDHGSRH